MDVCIQTEIDFSIKNQAEFGSFSKFVLILQNLEVLGWNIFFLHIGLYIALRK